MGDLSRGGVIFSLLHHQDGSSIFHLGRSIVLVAIGSFPPTEVQWLFVEKLLFRGKQGFYLPTGRASAVGGERGRGWDSPQSPLVDFFCKYSFCFGERTSSSSRHCT